MQRANAGLQIRMIHTNINTGDAKMPHEKDLNPAAAQPLREFPTETDEQRQKRTGLSSLEMTEQESVAVAKTKNRVTLESINAKIVHEEYINPTSLNHMTICILKLENGFALVGKSAPADPENFNRAFGEKMAREDAIRQMWVLEGYLLRERLSL